MMGVAEGIEPVLRGVVARCLRIAPEAIDPHAPLACYGLDSLSAVELRVALAEATGIEVSEDEWLDSPSIRELAGRLMNDAALPADVGCERMLADARLPADIDPSQVEPVANAADLLTGATGFLGVHLLKELINAGAEKIVCPVRARNDQHAFERIQKSLRRYQVVVPSLRERVIAIRADLGHPHLARDTHDYERLAHEVGCVYHCAAEVNWALGYEGLRYANVQATQNLLRFACTGVRKRFHFVSSAAACYSTRARAPMNEAGAAAELAGIHLGYAQSKWVGERLIDACRARGLDALLYRPGLISAASSTALGNDEDLLAQLIRGVIALGYAPDLDWRLDACPVDFVAAAIVGIARSPSRALPAVHLRNPRPAHWAELVLWMNLRGYRVALEPFADWIARVERASCDASHVLHGLRGFLLQRPAGEGGRTLAEIYADPSIARLDAERSDALVAGLGVRCPRLSSALLDRTFDNWIERGVVPMAQSKRVRHHARPAGDNAQIEACLQNYFADPGLRVRGFRRHDFGAEHSILGELASWSAGAATVMHARSIELARTHATRSQLDVVVKPKYSDSVVLAVATEVAALCSPQLGAAFAGYGAATGLMGNMRRELGVYARATGALRTVLPTCYGEYESCGVRVLLLERVSDIAPLDRVFHAQIWTHAEMQTVVCAIGRIHGEWLQREGDILQLLGGDLGTGKCVADLSAMPLWTALSAFARPWMLRWIGESGARLQARLADTAHEWLTLLDNHPRTLIHNDFNPRNFVLRPAQALELCAFDWELAQYGLPQRDLVELLCFAFSTEHSQRDLEDLIAIHRETVQHTGARILETGQWMNGLRLALADFGMRRLPMYCMAHRFRPQRYLERVTRTWMRLAQIFGLTRWPACGLACR